MREVNVDLKENSYKIVIGSGVVEQLVTIKEEFNLSKKAMVISDSNVAQLYGKKINELLKKAGFDVELAVVQAGENAKSFESAQSLYTVAIEAGLDRKSPIIALGGGVVGDLAGFIAATYMRGVPFFQIPTSLLAQVDSSVGGKVAVNHELGKNLIGSFYQPQKVLIDLDMLDTLPIREISTGLAEIIKYGCIYDADLFKYLDDNERKILVLDKECMEHIIARSCEIKAAVVSEDEKEAGLRVILNFGHTMAHAIENETHYEKYNHGEAVAIGMYGAAMISNELGLIEAADVAAIKRLIYDYKLPLFAEECSTEHLFKEMFRDKKAADGRIKWVLIDNIGHATTSTTVGDALVKKILREIQKKV